MENINLLVILQTIVSLGWAPIMYYMNLKNAKEEKKNQKQEIIEQKITLLEQQIKLNALQIDSLNNSQKEIREDMKDVKQGIAKLLEKLIR